jgi:acetylornithine deacetylase
MNHLDAYVESNQDQLIQIVQELVRIPSENTPPAGNEGTCQRYIADLLQKLSWETMVYQLSEVEGLVSHHLYWPGREYIDRPNVCGRKQGQGGGRSLILSGHIDTVPRGSQPWSRDPFGGQVEKGRLYGRGSNDMKGGLGISLFVAKAFQELGIGLLGDLLIESVVDEEFGGVNGTLAGRLMGFSADAAIIGEPTFPKVWENQPFRRCVRRRGAVILFILLFKVLAESYSGVGRLLVW